MTTPLSEPIPRWPIFRGLVGWRMADLGPDMVAGLTLAAIAIPEQMATARLGGFPPTVGFIVFITATLGFVVFGSSRAVSIGADSTITPIFAGALALLATSGSPHYFALAAMLAVMAGAILMAAGFFRLGWIASLLSIPVMTGFLAGIAIHIVVSQLPALIGVLATNSDPIGRVEQIVANLKQASIYSLALGLGVFAVTFLSEKIDSRIPGALIALIGATCLVAAFGLERHGVAIVGTVAAIIPHIQLPDVSINDIVRILPLALIIAIVTMVQTAATTRAFAADDRAPDVNGDFIGVGAGSILSGLFGGFAANASPPRTAAVSETGGKSQVSGIVAVAGIATLLLFGAALTARIPIAALAGVLLFVAQRIVRISLLVKIWSQSRGEFLLILGTIGAIVMLPIQTGVGLGIVLSLLHGVWTITRTRPIELDRIPGSTVWWPQGPKTRGERVEGILVLAFQAPLSFINADIFERDMLKAIDSHQPLNLVVLEANGIVEIDFTAAQSLIAIIRHSRARNIDFAIARLESTRAQTALDRFGVTDLLGADRLFHSVQDAVQACGKVNSTGTETGSRS